MSHHLPQQTAADTVQALPEKVTFYHWLVIIIASAGWLFDCMDQRLFVLARESALRELLGSDAAAQAALKTYIGYATTAMIIGWATGGIFFGMMSDKWGRVKTMVATLLVYSGFTGLCGFAQGWVDFTIYRFLVGLGVGGMFGAATTLVAESVPSRIRALALGSLQALSAIGNIIGSLISLNIQPGAENFWGNYSGWRVLFFVGILPSLLVVPIIFVLREPERGRQAPGGGASGRRHKQVGSLKELFATRAGGATAGRSDAGRFRHDRLVGHRLLLAGTHLHALKDAPQATVDTVRGWGTAICKMSGRSCGMVCLHALWPPG
jgi:MFS family permease